MPRRVSALAATVASLFLASCGGGYRCPAGRVCGAATWLPTTGGAAVEGRHVAAPAVEVANASGLEASRDEALRVRAEPVLLRFDLGALAGATTIEQAVLALTPHPAWRPTGAPSRLYARAVLSSWNANSVASGAAPSLSESPMGYVVLPGTARTPVRLDVTEAVRAWLSGAVPSEGLSLTSPGGDVVFVGVGTLAQDARPRLEVVLR